MQIVPLLVAVMMVESGGNPDAYNESENAVGAYQIRELAVKDINRHYGTDYELEDFYNPILSRWAFLHYGRMYGAKTSEEYARIWNGGPNGNQKSSTKKYWKKVQHHLKE